MQKLGNGSADQRRSACLAIGRFGRSARDAVPALMRALEDRDRTVAVLAVVALGRIGPSASAAIPALSARLGDERYLGSSDLTGRVVNPDPVPVASALARIGQESTPFLLHVLATGNDEARGEAAMALGQTEPPPRAAVGALIAALKHKKVWVRAEAVGALGHVGVGSREAVAALEASLGDEELFDVYGRVIVRALSDLGAPPVAFLRKAIDERQFSYFGHVSLMKGDGRVLIPALTNALQDKDSDVRSAAFDALSRFGSSAAEAAPALVESLRRKGDIEPFEVAALGRLGAAAEPARSRSCSGYFPD